jgi:GNAT superfamily N-acetyltransferase
MQQPRTNATVRGRQRLSVRAVSDRFLRHTGRVDIRIAGREDVSQLARLLWLDTAPEEQARQSFDSFADDLDAWWSDREASHLAFVARRPPSGRGSETELVGMAWLALVPRVPRPGATARFAADVQAVFVVPEARGQGIGSALVREATQHALSRGALRVTVHSGRRAVPVYERLGFASSGRLLMRSAE